MWFLEPLFLVCKKSESLDLKTILFLIIILVPAYSQEPACCEEVSGACRNACKQVSLENLSKNLDHDPEESWHEKYLNSVSLLCPSHLVRFWSCMNDTLESVKEGSDWSGRSCCPLAQSGACLTSCYTSSEIEDLQTKCRRSDEVPLFTCLHRQQRDEECCSQSNRADCVSTCKNILAQTHGRRRVGGVKKRLKSSCEKESPVITCVLNYTHTNSAQQNLPNPHKFLSCCSFGRTGECVEGCRKSFSSHFYSSDESVIMERLVRKGCGHPRPDDKMWQCFLQRAEPRVVTTEIPPYQNFESPQNTHISKINTELNCCTRGRLPPCRRPCPKVDSILKTGKNIQLNGVPGPILRLADSNPEITVRDMRSRLSPLLSTPECSIGLYLGLGTELVLLIRPTGEVWTKERLLNCANEAQRLSSLVNSPQSPKKEIQNSGHSYYKNYYLVLLTSSLFLVNYISNLR